MKIELDLNQSYNQPSDDTEILSLIDGPVHLIELSKTNVQRLLTIANQVNLVLPHIFSSKMIPSSSIQLIKPIECKLNN